MGDSGVAYLRLGERRDGACASEGVGEGQAGSFMVAAAEVVKGLGVALFVAYTLAFVVVMLLIEFLLVQPLEARSTRWRPKRA